MKVNIMNLEKDKINTIKNNLVQSLCNKFKNDLKQTEIQLKHIQQAAIEAPGAMQSHHDVSKDEYSKLAVNLENQIIKLQEGLEILKNYKIKGLSQDKIAHGSLIETIHNKQKRVYFLLPVGSAETIEDSDLNEKVIVINPESPIGSSLLNKGVNNILKIGSGELKIINIY